MEHSVIYIVIGIIGVVGSGMLSKFIFTSLTGRKRPMGRAFDGKVPVWLSLINIASWACILFGIGKLIFSK